MFINIGSDAVPENRSLRMFIYILDDDSLLNIFHLCRPVLLDDDVADDGRILEGGEWARERWWYRLVQVCQRWRSLILASASHLRLSLLCTYGIPVTKMLAHSPLPLTIDYLGDDRDIATEEEGIILALQHRDRVRRIRLRVPLLNLQKFILAMDGEFPILEYLFIEPPTGLSSELVLPNTFKAPHLRHLVLSDFGSPIVTSPSLITGISLVTLSIQNISPSAHSHPTDLLQQLSLLPYLEILGISVHSPVPNHEVERKLLHKPVTTHVTLPNLRWFGFRGASTYLEALLPQMTTPLLEKLQISFFRQPNYYTPYLLQFMGATKSLRFDSARLALYKNMIDVEGYPHQGTTMYNFSLSIHCRDLDWQVVSGAQTFRSLRTVFSAVEHLTLEFFRYPISPEANNEVDRIHWRELLMSFSNVKTLHVDDDFFGQISRCLQVDDGESPTQLFPELKELEYSMPYAAKEAFMRFIVARQNAGCPVTLIPLEKS